MRSRCFARAAVVAVALALLPVPSLARGLPRTLAATQVIGSLSGASSVVRPSFKVGFLGVSWARGAEPQARFLTQGARWTGWTTVHEDEIPVTDGRTFSSLVAAGDALAYQLRGTNAGVRAVVINTTSGPRPLRFAAEAPAHASHLAQPSVISRAEWGADESYRFKADGTEDWPQTFHATEKLIVHHTATGNDDPDPAATVRAIYRYHAIDRAYGDIGYSFLIDGQGRIYKGRYSGSLGTRVDDTPSGEDAQGRGATAAHTGGWNSGTMGIAILGTHADVGVPPPARSAIVEHLAWEAEHHGLDPLASDTFTNPVSGDVKTTPNISGHRDWVATECPGGRLYADLPAIRNDVAERIAAPGPDTAAPGAPSGLSASGARGKITLSWSASTDTGGSGLAGYEIWRSSNGSSFTLTARTGSSRYTDNKLPRRTAYWYYVIAYDGAGNRSAPSNTASAKTT